MDRHAAGGSRGAAADLRDESQAEPRESREPPGESRAGLAEDADDSLDRVPNRAENFL